jgi:hypothetical protein
MTRNGRFFAFSILVVLTGACSADGVTNSLGQPVDLTFADARKSDTRSRANYFWADSVNVGTADAPSWVGAGIRGDGRLKDGSTAPAGGSRSNEYQGNYCGVNALLDPTTYGSETLDFTPGLNWTSRMQARCGSMRTYHFYLNGPGSAPYAHSSHSLVRGLDRLAVDQTTFQWEGFGVALPNRCDRVMFNDDYPPSNSPIQTRLSDSTRADGVQLRRWTVASRGSHLAVCGYMSNNVFVTTGAQYYLPFVLTITEVPYPYPTYP